MPNTVSDPDSYDQSVTPEGRDRLLILVMAVAAKIAELLGNYRKNREIGRTAINGTEIE